MNIQKKSLNERINIYKKERIQQIEELLKKLIEKYRNNKDKLKKIKHLFEKPHELFIKELSNYDKDLRYEQRLLNFKREKIQEMDTMLDREIKKWDRKILEKQREQTAYAGMNEPKMSNFNSRFELFNGIHSSLTYNNNFSKKSESEKIILFINNLREHIKQEYLYLEKKYQTIDKTKLKPSIKEIIDDFFNREVKLFNNLSDPEKFHNNKIKILNGSNGRKNKNLEELFNLLKNKEKRIREINNLIDGKNQKLFGGFTKKKLKNKINKNSLKNRK
jgi:hypothetical protein